MDQIDQTDTKDKQPDESEILDVLIIGAGPAGLQAACTAQELGLTHRILDRRGLAHSFVEYPQTLRFFSPPDEMEIGGVPLPMRGGEKPTREDILPYFRAVAVYKHLHLSLWESITRVINSQRDGGMFHVETVREPNHNTPKTYCARRLLLTSGVWDVPNSLNCPGADLPHVFARYHEPTEFFGQDVLVVGGGNSAVYAALSLAEAQARVTFAMRRAPVAYQSHLRPFVVRDLMLAVEDKRLALLTDVAVTRIDPEYAWLQPFAYDAQHTQQGRPTGEPYAVPARFVFALVGQRADTQFFNSLGLCLEPDGRPVCNPETYETTVPGIYVAGSLAGNKIDIIVIAREQTAEVVRHIATRLQNPE